MKDTQNRGGNIREEEDEPNNGNENIRVREEELNNRDRTLGGEEEKQKKNQKTEKETWYRNRWIQDILEDIHK